ncbi:MAG: hypothetical protein JW891_02895 [Candidatus Lokiarchaeota archaeon]|nr:hypothetical protein [Candidatus Lokiarchaeota archaeon]
MKNGNDKIRDFANMWGDKKETPDNVSIIRDFMKRIEQLEEENINLRNRITQNESLIAKTEDIVNQAKKNKNELENEVSTLKTSSPPPTLTPPPGYSQADLAVNQSLIKDLQSELTKKKNQINEFKDLLEKNESMIRNLQQANENLTSQLLEKEKGKEKNKKEKPGAKSPLDALVQDLQADLNRYKKQVGELKDENQNLRNAIESKGGIVETDLVKSLNDEINTLKSQLEELTDKKSKKNKVQELKELLQEKDQLIEQLQKKPHFISEQPSTQTTISMPSLVEELQSKINKLKIIIKEKDELIQNIRGH